MKILISIVLIALLSFAACLYLPWWIVAIVSFIVVAFININWWKAFIAGFLAIFILWGAISWFISDANGHLLAHRLAPLIIKADSPAKLIHITALIGALVGGFAGVAGSFVRADKKL